MFSDWFLKSVSGPFWTATWLVIYSAKSFGPQSHRSEKHMYVCVYVCNENEIEWTGTVHHS